jgi:hypothetical protein
MPRKTLAFPTSSGRSLVGSELTSATRQNFGPGTAERLGQQIPLSGAVNTTIVVEDEERRAR